MTVQWDEGENPAPRVKGKGGKADPNINWNLAEKLYVEGELVGEAEHVKRVYPSLADIARRANTTKTNMAGRSWRYNWAEKRHSFQAANGVVPAFTQGAKMPASDQVPRRLAKRDPESVLRAYIDLFAEAVEKRTIRYDCIADLDKAIRLLAFVRGQAESTKHVHVSVSLEAMQARHRALRQLVASRVDDDVAGVLGSGTPAIDASGVLVDDVEDPDAWDAGGDVDAPEAP